MMNPRYLQRFGEPPPFGDPIARAALRYDPEAAYGDPELGDNEGQRLFEPLDVKPTMNKDSLVGAEGPMSQPSVTAPPSAPMENPIVRAGRERAELEAAGGNPAKLNDFVTAARAALRDDPDAPYGNPELEGTEGQRQFEQPDVQPSMNKNSLVAAEGPMDLRQAAMPPPDGEVSSIPEQFSQVRPGSRYRGWNVDLPPPSAAVGGGPATPESRWPVNDFVTARKPFQPPPTIESNAAKSIVPIKGEPEIEPGRLLQPPVIDTRELPTEAPPENPIRRYQRELDELKAPERGPVSKWAKLAAVALGAGQGYYNAANPNAKPIDASEAVQNLTLGRKYIDAMGEYQRKRKDIGERIKLAGEAEDIESRIADRTETQASRKAANDERIRQDNLVRESKEAAALDKRRAILVSLEDKGETRIPIGAPLPSGMVEGGHDPLFEMGADGTPAYRRVRDPNHGLVKVPDEIIKTFPGLPKYLDKQVFQVVIGNLTKAAPTNNLNDNTLLELRSVGQRTGVPSIDALTPKQAGDALSRLKPPKSEISVVNLTPEGLDQSARRYLKTNELPSLGMGDKGTRQRIINRAAELDGDADLADNKAEYQANKGALAFVNRQYRVSQSAEKTADKTLRIVSDVSSKVDRTGSPFINRYLLYLKGQVAGDTETQKLDNAIETASSEYARVIAGGTGNQQLTDAAQAKGKRMLQAAMGNKTLNAVMAQMRLEMKAKTTAYTDVLNELRGNDPPNEGPGRSGGGNVPARPAGVPKNAVFDPVTKEWVEP